MAKTLKDEVRDRTDLANEWAAAVAELDEAREVVLLAQKKEYEAWEALKQSRALSVRSEFE